MSSVVVIATYPVFGLAYDPTGAVADVPRSGILLLAVGSQQLAVLTTMLAGNRVGVGVLNVYTYTQTVHLLRYAVLVVPPGHGGLPRLSAGPAAAGLLHRTARAALFGALLGLLALVAVRPGRSVALVLGGDPTYHALRGDLPRRHGAD